MSDAIPPAGLEVAKQTLATRARAQLRLLLAALAGALVGRHLIPASFADDTVIDALCSLIFYVVSAAWQDRRALIAHMRLWWLAHDPRVPDDIIRPKEEKKP